MNQQQLAVLKNFAHQASGSLGTMDAKMRRDNLGQQSLPETAAAEMAAELFGEVQEAIDQMDRIFHLLDTLEIEIS
jgi:hypothetical protein